MGLTGKPLSEGEIIGLHERIEKGTVSGKLSLLNRQLGSSLNPHKIGLIAGLITQVIQGEFEAATAHKIQPDANPRITNSLVGALQAKIRFLQTARNHKGGLKLSMETALRMAMQLHETAIGRQAFEKKKRA
ncbi:MAG: hypothetical protein V1835_05095 [Candidatus Micrarchaeota archaeon]